MSQESKAGALALRAENRLFAYLCAVFVSCLLLGDVIGGLCRRSKSSNTESTDTNGAPRFSIIY